MLQSESSFCEGLPQHHEYLFKTLLWHHHYFHSPRLFHTAPSNSKAHQVRLIRKNAELSRMFIKEKVRARCNVMGSRTRG